MTIREKPVGATSLALAAGLCLSLVLGAKFRRDRTCCAERRTCTQDTQDEFKSIKSVDDNGTSQEAALDRRAPENEVVFSLYGGGESDAEPSAPPMKLSTSVLALLKSFDVDPVRGFLPSMDPLRRLPQAELQPWEAMAAALPSLLAVGRARKPLETLPVLSIDVLTCHRERMRALHLLCVFAHASVWGDNEHPQDTIPKGIAIPLSALAASEGLPPLLTHTSVVLHNWHRLDPSGPIRTENLASNCQFLGGLDETWFYIATVEIEARGGGVFGALLEAHHAIAEVGSASTSRASSAVRTVLAALAIAKAGIESMREALSRMPVGCHPLIFYQRVRPFLSGWKANPTLPDGVLYEGVSSRRQQYYGGSAAQSTLFPALDAALDVSHSMHSSNAFLLEMRNYMPPGHRRLLEHLSDPACPSIRSFVQSFGNEQQLSVGGSGEDYVNKKTPGNPENGNKPRGNPENGNRPPGNPENGNKPPGNPENGNKPPGSPENGNKPPGNPENGNKSPGNTENGDCGSLGDGGHRSTAGNGRVEETTKCHVASCTTDELREAYNGCLSALRDFRSTHMRIVGSYILQQQKGDQKAGDKKSREDFAGGKGTGGTPLLDFLKPLKEDSRAARLE